MLHLKTHSTGLRYVIVDSPSPISSVSLWFKCGSRHDPEGKAGLSHFFEHLFLNKTVNEPDRIRRLQDLAKKGIETSAYTTYETSHYQAMQISDQTEEAVRFLLSCLKGFNADVEDVEREKGVILDEIARRDADPSSFIRTAAPAALWPKSTFSKGILGSVDTVSTIMLDDIQKFFKDHYQPSDAILMITGSFSDQNLQSIIAEYVEPSVMSKEKEQSEQFADAVGHSHIQKEMDFRLISVNFRGAPQSDHESRIALELISKILGDTWIARLTNRLRIKKDLTYWVDGNTSNFKDTGYIRWQCSTEESHVEEILNIIEEEIERLKLTPIEDQEMDAHKRLWKTSFLKQNICLQDLVWNYGYQFCLTDSCLTIEEEIEKLGHVVSKDIQKIANRFLIDQARSIVVLGG
jgi:predicted Zn-dependent peptidase